MKVSVIGLRGFPKIQGGVEKHCESLYTKFGNDVCIIVYRRKPYINTNVTYNNIKFIDLPSTKIKGFEAFFHSFISSIHALIDKPDIVHYHNIGPALFSPIIKIRKIPIILTYHSANYEHDKWSNLSKKLLKLSEIIALNTADRIIFVNKYQMEKYNNDIKIKSVYIPNGINKIKKAKGTGYLKKIGVKRNKYILSVGRITKEKGFDTLIKAFTIAKLKNIKLVIAGGIDTETKYMEELQFLSKGQNVIFTDSVFDNELQELYSNAAFFVLSSNNEGFPLVLLEAMSNNLDVIVSDIPGTHLVQLEPNCYFEKGNYKELAVRMNEHLKIVKKYEYNLDEFDWNTIAKETNDVYKEATKRK